MLGNYNGFSAGSGLATVATSYVGADLAVCSGSITECQFPSVRFIDGAYSDNNALNLQIAHLQKKHPGSPLRIAFLDNDPNPGADLGLNGNESALGLNFGMQSPEGYVLGFPSVPVQVFETEHYVEHVVSDVSSNLTMTQITCTTVENRYFGVQAGTSVALLVVNANGAYHGIDGTSMLTTAGTNNAQDYANTAQNIYEALTRTQGLHNFFSTGHVVEGFA